MNSNFFVSFLIFFVMCTVSYEKSSSTITVTTNSTTKKSNLTEKSLRSINSNISVKSADVSSKSFNKPTKLVCPSLDNESNVSRAFFSIRCKNNKDCTQLGSKNLLCCNSRCLKGMPPRPEEPIHSPTLFGLVGRVCPQDRIPEIFEIKKCNNDSDCAPRICCPEKLINEQTVGFCRTAEPKLDKIPAARQFMEPLRHIMSYMQCTPPPPPLLDVFPKTCNNPLDCFPNLCCQEGGRRFCRPPRRSLLTLLTTVAQRIVPSEVARDFLNRVAP